MMSPRMKPTLITVVILLIASPVRAQTAEPSVFASVAAMADIHRHGWWSSVPVGTGFGVPNMDTWTLASNWSVGVRHTPRWNTRVEMTFSGTYSKYYRTSSPFATQEGTQNYRLRVASVLLGYRRGPWKRLRLDYLAGVGFAQEREHRESETTFALPPPAPPRPPLFVDVTSTQYHTAVIVGADVSFALSRRVAIVQELRVKAFSGLLAVSPALGLVFGF
jgi:hypothetical protein